MLEQIALSKIWSGVVASAALVASRSGSRM
jgi:hypothetical protein